MEFNTYKAQHNKLMPNKQKATAKPKSKLLVTSFTECIFSTPLAFFQIPPKSETAVLTHTRLRLGDLNSVSLPWSMVVLKSFLLILTHARVQGSWLFSLCDFVHHFPSMVNVCFSYFLVTSLQCNKPYFIFFTSTYLIYSKYVIAFFLCWRNNKLLLHYVSFNL